ncbi:MAG: hypothetical protein WCK98_05090 [bacterium]
MPTLTKNLSKKTKLSPIAKSYQIRLTVTPKIHEDILKARLKYKYLDDIEIIKIFIGRGADLDNVEDLSYLSNSNWSQTSGANAFENTTEAMEFLHSLKK